MTLPITLPECGQPAAVRIEVFTIVPGPLPGSLDAVAYTCTEHAPDAVSAIEAADMEAHVVPMAPDIDQTCGHVHIFPTGGLFQMEQSTSPSGSSRSMIGGAPDDARPGDDQHPRWCARQDCQRRFQHRSPAMNVDTNRPEQAILDVGLLQALQPLAEPMVSMTAIDGLDAQHIVLSIGQARVLRYRLGNLIDMSKRGGR